MKVKMGGLEVEIKGAVSLPKIGKDLIPVELSKTKEYIKAMGELNRRTELNAERLSRERGEALEKSKGIYVD